MIKSAIIELTKADGPVEGPITKFGGMPYWLEKAQWPLSRTYDVLMSFLCQIALADVPSLPEELRSSGKIAYIFMTGNEYEPADTWDETAGENAVIIQPKGALPHVDTTDENVEQDEQDCFMECSVRLQTQEEPKLYNEHSGQLGTSIADKNWTKEISQLLRPNKLGGTPEYIQWAGCRSEGGPWLPLLQLHDEHVGTNFGSGTGYAYISEDGREGRFMWQC